VISTTSVAGSPIWAKCGRVARRFSDVADEGSGKHVFLGTVCKKEGLHRRAPFEAGGAEGRDEKDALEGKSHHVDRQVVRFIGINS
jgi:hypothetical protein